MNQAISHRDLKGGFQTMTYTSMIISWIKLHLLAWNLDFCCNKSLLPSLLKSQQKAKGYTGQSDNINLKLTATQWQRSRTTMFNSSERLVLTFWKNQ